MHFVAISDLIIPEGRIRRTFDEKLLQDLSESIVTQGLFHPILCRSDGYTLIAGERRIRAISKINEAGGSFTFDQALVPLGQVPVVTLTESDAIAVLDAELSENTKRQQLTWQEQALATEALHNLRQAQAPKHTIRDTAREVFGAEKDTGTYHRNISQDLIVAQFLDDPEVAKAPTRKDALRIIERKMERGHRESLAKYHGMKSVAASGECHLGKMQVELMHFPEGTFDCIIADPPYGIGADTFANQSAVRHAYADSEELSDDIYSFIAREGYHRCKTQAHAYLFCDPRRFGSIGEVFRARGWRVWPWPLIWYRGTTVGLVPWPEHGPRRTYEAICFAIKGDRRVTSVLPDVLNVPHDSSTERGAHKPPELYRQLIERSCLPGDKVLDPCCGTGPVFEAARLTHTYAVGIEVEAAAYGQAIERLKGGDV
jgi:16S rRNA G966 N2-methylase RsmD